MKAITILSLLLLTSSAFGELTKEDIRTIIKEEVRPIIKEEIDASEKRTREYIDLKFEATNARIEALDQRIEGVAENLNAKIGALDKSLNARIDDVRIIMIALISLVVAAIAVPQIIIAYRDRGQKEMQTQIDQLREQIEAMQNPPS